MVGIIIFASSSMAISHLMVNTTPHQLQVHCRGASSSYIQDNMIITVEYANETVRIEIPHCISFCSWILQPMSVFVNLFSGTEPQGCVPVAGGTPGDISAHES